MNRPDSAILGLVRYAVNCGLIEEADVAYATNGLLEALGCTDFDPTAPALDAPLEKLLAELCNHAGEIGLIEGDSIVARDLFDTKLMGVLTPRPSQVIRQFRELAAEPEAATDWFYKLCRDCDYIRTYRIARDRKWTVPSVYGEIDITINLSKPEKDPRAIAAAKLLPQSGYPKCLLCHECEGYAGNLNKPARQNLRQIPVRMGGQDWFFQYSPYVYYNEHCILLNSEHTPMKIDRSTFEKQLDFLDSFPHYFLGSNADLPIVGGSILSHDHMQGGRYTFAMAKAPIERKLHFNGFDSVEAGIVRWPMSTIRLRSADRAALVELADRIQLAWRGYTDADAFIFAETDGEPHNTVTPIARMSGKLYELDLVLRNNITTEEHPLGVYHPHADKHNIKKENIGLIEVMGLAVLPARLLGEMEQLAAALLAGADLRADEMTAKHADWVESFIGNYTVTEENVHEMLNAEIGKTFVRVLEDAGVYARTEAGQAAFVRFADHVNTLK
ncbi:MAG: UDP-glucose--hexose-1-phosphate uridylyltransferase [Clostridia bacterium]|nr:UDP-glucose--hexose-1-phosphate uridylyltransferase [Clostridia bacterium]